MFGFLAIFARRTNHMIMRNKKYLAVAAALLALSLSCGAQTPGQQETRLGWGDMLKECYLILAGCRDGEINSEKTIVKFVWSPGASAITEWIWPSENEEEE